MNIMIMIEIIIVLCTHSEIESISKDLSTNHYAVIDHFLADSVAMELYKAVHCMHSNGDLTLGSTGGGLTGNGEKTDGKRFDLITFVNVTAEGNDDQNSDEIHLNSNPLNGSKSDVVEVEEQKTESSNPQQSVFIDFIQDLDATVFALCCSMDDLKERMINRKNVMASCYEPGAFYISHVDNPNRNGRILTALLYLNPKWEDGDGGELRIHRCGCRTHS